MSNGWTGGIPPTVVNLLLKMSAMLIGLHKTSGSDLYRINRKDTGYFVPLGLFVRQPPEPLPDGLGQKVPPLNDRVPIKCLSCQAARERVPAFCERVAGIFVGCHELRYRDAVWRVWELVRGFVVLLGSRGVSHLPKGSFGTQLGGSKTILTRTSRYGRAIPLGFPASCWAVAGQARSRCNVK